MRFRETRIYLCLEPLILSIHLVHAVWSYRRKSSSEVLGATDPATAEDGAIRKMILDKSPSERDILVASFVSRRARM